MLADFGFSRQMSASTVMLTSIKGTPLYLAPEIFTDHAYEYKADLWGLGVMLYELAAGAPPFYANSLPALMGIIMSEAPKFPAHFSPAFVSFLSGLLVRDPARRAGWPELLHHPWVAEEASAGSLEAGASVASASTAGSAAVTGAASAGGAGSAASAPARSASGTPPIGPGAALSRAASSSGAGGSGTMVAPAGGRSPADESKSDASPGLAVGRGRSTAGGGDSRAEATAASKESGSGSGVTSGRAGGPAHAGEQPQPRRRSVSATQRAARVAPVAGTGAAAGGGPR